MSDGPPIQFIPVSEKDVDNYNIIILGNTVGTLFWKRNHPIPGMKVAIVHGPEGAVAIAPDEMNAIKIILKMYNRLETPPTWLPLIHKLLK